MKIATTKQRILQFIEYKHISKTLFFEKTGIKRGFLDSDKLNQAVSDDHFAKIIASFSDISMEWLISGNGEMLKDTSLGSIESIDEVNETLPIYNNVYYKEKYYELLEENRELRLSIEKLKETHQKQIQETEKCKKELEKFRKEKNSNAMLPV